MPYWRTYYHLTWATRYRTPLITPEIEALIFPVIVDKAVDLGAIVYALNGTEDHIHLAAAIPPRLAVAAFVGEIKGRASFCVNHQHPPLDLYFSWQAGYGVLTFGETRLPWVIEYVQRRKEHHAQQTTHRRLEASPEDDNGPPVVLPGRAVDDSAGE